MHGIVVYVKEVFPFACDLKLCRLFLMISTDFTTLRLTSLSSIGHLLCLCVQFFILISSKINEALIHHKDGLLFLVELIGLVNSVIIFLSQMTLLK